MDVKDIFGSSILLATHTNDLETWIQLIQQSGYKHTGWQIAIDLAQSFLMAVKWIQNRLSICSPLVSQLQLPPPVDSPMTHYQALYERYWLVGHNPFLHFTIQLIQIIIPFIINYPNFHELHYLLNQLILNFNTKIFQSYHQELDYLLQIGHQEKTWLNRLLN